MSRSNYVDVCDVDESEYANSVALWRNSVNRAIRGKRGQAFLRELRAALETLPDKKLIVGRMERDGCVCAIGAVGKARGVDMTELNRLTEEEEEDEGRWGEAIGSEVAETFGIAEALAREIMWVNDEAANCLVGEEPDAHRYYRVMAWVDRHILR